MPLNEMIALIAKCKACMLKNCVSCGIADVVEEIENAHPELIEPK